MFLRLSEGNYEFGTRPLSLKLNRGMVFIKQGTNMTPIDQVLPNMLPEELAKFEGRDPLRRITGESAALSVLNETQSNIGGGGKMLSRGASKSTISPIKKR